MVKTVYFLVLVTLFCAPFHEFASAEEENTTDFTATENENESTSEQFTNPETEQSTSPAPEKPKYEETPPITYTFPSTSQIIWEVTSPSGELPQSDSWVLQQNPITVQKCCKPHQALQLGVPGQKSECQDIEDTFVIDVFYANSTHYWKFTNSSGDNVKVVTRDPCTESKFELDPFEEDDKFHLLHNASLYIPSWMDMLNTSQYCVDFIIKGGLIATTAIICTSNPETDFFTYLFGIGLLISTTSLILLAIYSSHRKDIDEDHKKCLIFFSSMMAINFFCLSISTFFNSKFNEIGSILLAYIVYYLKFNYYIWLNILCYDTYRCVKLATDDTINKKSFMRRYLLIAFLTPLIFILINLIDKGRPALPNLYIEHIFSSSFLWCLFLFYIPILISVIANVVICSSIVLPKNRCKTMAEFLKYMKSENWKPPLAPESITILKNMYRRTYYLGIIMLIFLIIDMIIFLLPSSGKLQLQFMIRNIVYCLQGFFISCIFIRKDCLTRKKTEELNITELQPMTNNDCV